MTFANVSSSLNKKRALLIGSSMVAVSLVRRLTRAGARVRWLSRDLDIAEELWLSGEPRQIEIAFSRTSRR
jgi:siroheme synthase (precorrin-2 oxidase/ferrochelatase)